MSDTIKHFLLTFDIGRQTADVREFGEDYEAALTAYDAAEDSVRFDPQIEVVLLGADSLETLKKTHSSYFMGTPAEHPFASFLRNAAAAQG
ncbi:MAG: hypothetical protein ITG02_08890 [Patulibacter sp.]|nr:hypothetical protein [Patulibacter sp.]